MALGHLRDDLLADDPHGAQPVLLSLHHEANQHMGEAQCFEPLDLRDAVLDPPTIRTSRGVPLIPVT
jgi:hypothetical protein